MRVTLQVEADALDEEEVVVGTVTASSLLEDDLGVYPADIVTVYDDLRHEILIKLTEKGQHPRWDYRPRDGKN